MKSKLIALVAALIIPLASAQAANMYIEGGTPTASAGYGQIALSFQVTSAISVTDLSFFGISMGGGDTPYVQLWNTDTSTVLGSVAWTAGTATNGWNNKALSSAVTLNTGVNYQVQASAYWVNEYANDSGFTYGSEFTGVTFYGGTGWSGWTPPLTPTTLADNPTSNVNFIYSAVPEPSTYALLGAGLVGLVVLRRRAKVKA